MEKRDDAAPPARWWLLDTTGAVLVGLGIAAWAGALEGTPVASIGDYAWPLVGLGLSFGMPSALHRLRAGGQGRRIRGGGLEAGGPRRSLVRH